ncbi:hypothetical protein AB1N83_003814 [Pleurotus pulmonarius]
MPTLASFGSAKVITIILVKGSQTLIGHFTENIHQPKNMMTGASENSSTAFFQNTATSSILFENPNLLGVCDQRSNIITSTPRPDIFMWTSWSRVMT